jgi:DNA-binding LacI/PurR family transcriptional regulator
VGTPYPTFVSKLKQIAQLLKTSPSTVSRALRNDPRISLNMRKRVDHEARKLEYLPDQGISSVMQRVRSGADYVEASIGIWWPGSWSEKELLNRYPNLAKIIEAIRGTATALHFNCETRDGLPEEPAAAARILRNRGVRGLILLPGNPEVFKVPQAFDNFVVVAVGNAVQGKVPSRIVTHFEDAYAVIFEELHARGYRRPGICVREEARGERLYESRYLGAYEHACRRLGWFEPVEPLSTSNDRPKQWKMVLEGWLKQQQPDAVVIPYGHTYETLKMLTAWPIPHRLGCVATCTKESFPELSGPSTNNEAVGREAAFALFNRLRTAVPDLLPETRILVKTTWYEGATLPVRRRKLALKA